MTPGERWVAFLRGYGPINRIEGMYAETIPAHARRFGATPLMFRHPEAQTLFDALDPSTGQLTNVVLTGTAGDGKTTLCNEIWNRFGGADDRSSGKNRASYRSLDVETPCGSRRIHFLFEFTGWSADKGQSWTSERLDLMNRFARSVRGTNKEEYFIIAANDGRLVQTWDTLPTNSDAASLGGVIEELLASDDKTSPGHDLLFLNLSRMPTKRLLEEALTCLLDRPEWCCLTDEAGDPAFSPLSPLARNYRLLQDTSVRDRLLALADLMDANGLHVPIREILLLLVNTLLGCEDAPEGVADAASLRRIVEVGQEHRGILYANVFGANLTERRREASAVFRHLGAFRIGHETTNFLDGLIIYGPQDPMLKMDHDTYLGGDAIYGKDPLFETLRHAYLEAEEERGEGAVEFLKALVNERRRLFFKLPEADGRLDPWKLSIFESAGRYRRDLLAPLKSGRRVEPAVVKLLVCGLNRAWTGMLAGDLDRLYLSTGLDLSSARVSDIHLHEVPLRRSPHGEEVSVILQPNEAVPTLRISLDASGRGASLRLHLFRFEFLVRVAQGALPGSFSKECNEDILAFKTQVLSEYYSLVGDISGSLSRLSDGPRGSLNSHQLGVSL